MITVKPMRGFRADGKWVEQIAALPYDVVSDEEARRVLIENPYSFLAIDKPELIEAGEEEKSSYARAKQRLDGMVNQQMYVEEGPCFYIYEQVCEYTHQYGLVCLVSAQDYEQGRIKRHELTLQSKEEDRVEHISTCRAHTGPVFLVENANAEFEYLLEQYMSDEYLMYQFKAQDNSQHSLYRVLEEDQIERLVDCFNQVDSLYIADGHHRAAAAVRVAKENGEMKYGANEFLAVIFPKNNLCILPYHRLIRDRSGYTKEEVFKQLEHIAEVYECTDTPFYPEEEHHIGMYYKQHWYQLVWKNNVLQKGKAVDLLDVTLLQQHILAPIFDIMNPRDNPDIDFVAGTKRCDTKLRGPLAEDEVIFTLHRTAIETLMEVADNGGVMPPKSTWFEPKLLSGMVLHFF